MQQLGADTDKSILLCDDDNDLSARLASDSAVSTTLHVPPECQVTVRSYRHAPIEPCAFPLTPVRWPVEVTINDRSRPYVLRLPADALGGVVTLS